MRENRTSGSEGGEAQTNELSLPLSGMSHPVITVLMTCGASGPMDCGEEPARRRIS